MPTVVNGIGTWYWGRRNISTRRRQCEFCNRIGDLASYDTTLFMVFLFVPIVPLKAKRILDSCPHCKRHRALGLKEWDRMRTHAMGEAGLRWKENPLDPALAIDLIGATAAFQAPEELGGVVASLDPFLMRNPKVLTTLAAAFDHLNMFEDAEESLRSLAQVEPGRDSDYALAVFLLKRGRPDEARPLIDSILSAATREDLGLMYLAVESYQSIGAHDKALDLLNAYTPKFPGIEKTPDHKKYVKTSTKNLGRARPIKSALIQAGAEPSSTGQGWGFRVARTIPLITVLVALAFYLLLAFFRGESRPVYIVNGLHRAYDVTIAGQRVSIPAQSHREVRVAEGDLPVHLVDTSIGIPDQSIPIHTSFFARPFLNRTFVINPDGMALLVWEQATYAATAVPGGNSTRLYSGQSSYTLNDLDYKFVEFPSSLQLPSSSAAVLKTRIAQPVLDRIEQIEMLASLSNRTAAAEFAKRGMMLEPSNPDFLDALNFLLKPDEMIALVKPLTAKRPLQLQVHRAYQHAMERAHPEHDLLAEYQPLLDADPKSPQLQYLVARILPDHARARELFLSASKGQPPEPTAFRALAYDFLSQGDFDQALTATRAGLAITPKDRALQAYEQHALLGLGRAEECLNTPAQQTPSAKLGFPAIVDRIYLYIAASKPDEALSFIQQTVGGPGQESVRNYLQGLVAYGRGDIAEFSRLTSGVPNPDPRFSAAITESRLADAEQVLDSTPPESSLQGSEPHMLVALAAHLAGNKEVFDRRMALAVKELRTGTRDDRTLASWLAGDSKPAAGEVLAIPLNLEVKLRALPLLAARHPDRRQECDDLARKLNFDPRFPHLLIAQAIDPPKK